MQSQINEHLAHALVAERTRRASNDAEHHHPPPGRVRVRAALALIALAGRLDHEHTRRAQHGPWSAHLR